MNYVLMNPKANNCQGEQDAREWAKCLKEDCQFIDVLTISDMGEFIGKLDADDVVYLCGGDGTLNHFVNDVAELNISNDVYYIKCGSGNDFYRDNKERCDELGRIRINELIKNLPIVSVNGIKRRFINGIGYGIDGESCRVGEEIRMNSSITTPINYTNIAIKLLLGKYKLRKATVTVDGITKEFKNVWMVPTMKGRYYGGGMMVAPNQNRDDESNKVTVVALFKRSRLLTLMRFPSIFEGKHVLKKDWIYVAEGKNVTVTFDIPCALQIDGETIKDVLTYSVEVSE